MTQFRLLFVKEMWRAKGFQVITILVLICCSIAYVNAQSMPHNTKATAGLMKSAVQPVQISSGEIQSSKEFTISNTVNKTNSQGNNYRSEENVLITFPGMNISPTVGPAGAYLPLSIFGITPIAGMGDTSLVNFNVPAFKWAGKIWTHVGVASDGYVVVGGSTISTPTNSTLPNVSAPLNILAPFWTNLNPTLGGAVRIATLTDGNNTWLVVDWNGVSNATPTNTNSFQIWIRLGTTPDVVFSYDSLSTGNNGLLTIGAQDTLGNVGALWYLDGNGTLPVKSELRVNTATFLANQTQIDFGEILESESRRDTVKVYNPDSLKLQIFSLEFTGSTPTEFQVNPASATINSGDSATFVVTFLPTSPGSKSAELHFHHNAPGNTWNVSLSGNVLSVTPNIASVNDLPLDQGGTVVVNWNKSTGDRRVSNLVTEYLMWRGIRASSISGSVNVVSRENYLASMNQGLAQTFMTVQHHVEKTSSSDTIYWQYITSLPAHNLDHYSYACSTLADSIAAGVPWRYFFITAATANPEIYWDSPIDSGYSIDNIPPVGISGAVIGANQAGHITLNWNKNREDKDLNGYVIYKSTTSGFLPDETSKLVQLTDTTFIDTTIFQGTPYFYRIAGIDVHGNIGTPSEELTKSVLSVKTEIAAPKVFGLSQNYPNPFNPSTKIKFTVATEGRAILKVFNTLGQEIATLFDDVAAAGEYHQVLFDASKFSSGIYLIRLESNGNVMLKKMLLIK